MALYERGVDSFLEAGHYHFSLPGDVRGGELRELRDPNTGLEEEWPLPVGDP